MKVCLGQVYSICFIGHRIDFCARLALRIQLGGWLYKPEVSFSQKRSQRVLFWYWQYCEGILFGFQGCIDQGFDVFDCVDIISMRAVDEFFLCRRSVCILSCIGSPAALPAGEQ